MARGLVWAIYVDDIGRQWGLQVDADYVLDADRGWATDGVGDLSPLPRGWQPRRVLGLDESGRMQTAVAASLAAAIWTGLVPTFVFETSDATLAVADIIGRRAELRRVPRPG